MNVVRLNQRNCGDTEHLSAGLFHSGLTADAEVRHRRADRRSTASAGDRRGRLLARRQPRAEAGRRVRRRAAAAVLRRSRRSRRSSRSASASTRSSGRGNLLYQWNFVRGPEAADAAEGPLLAGPLRSQPARRDPDGPRVRRGLHGAALRLRRRRRLLPSRQRDAGRSIASACPTLIITAEDDPFVPSEPFRDPKVTGNPHITLHICRARRPLRLRRPAQRRRRRRLLGGEPDRGVRRSRHAASR